ncbi:MAG: ExbD/TolR family protein [Chitinophagaceae bacterium]
MPKVKMPRKSTHVDMTAMCDVAFLLLTFFMLTTKFKPQEPVTVVTPASISTKLLPESNVVLITISKDGRVFFSLDKIGERKQLMENLDKQYHLGLNAEQIRNYAIGSSVGMPIAQLKQYLSLPLADEKTFKQPGIPLGDSVAANNNELAQWIAYAVDVNNGAHLAFCVKADDNSKFEVVNKVLETLKLHDHMKLHLVTSLEKIPTGTVAYKEMQAGKNPGQ